MTRYILNIFLAGYLFSGNISFAQLEFDSVKIKEYITIADQITSTALREAKGYAMLREFCEIGPRLSGSENSIKAINWAFEKMNELGFDKVWLQPVMVPKWVRGEKETAKILGSTSTKEKYLEILALGGSIGTDVNGVTSAVIVVNSFEELSERKDEVKDKIVLLNRKLDQGTLNTFTGYSNAVDQRVYGAIEGAKNGAAAVLVRSVTTKHDNVPHTGIMFYEDSLKKIPAAAIGNLDADYLVNALVSDPNLKVNIKMNCKTLDDIQSFNVIGEIVGRELPEEIILVGGHIDSWDVGDGAHDDAAGCIQSMEVLDLFNRLKIKPKRTLRCILFINEENGVRGSKEYALYSDTSKLNHLAAIESDRGAYTPVGFNVQTDSIEIINKINSWLPILERAGIKWVKKGGSGEDIKRIKKVTALMGYVPDDQRYMDIHHSASDVFEEVHPREFELGTAAITVMVYLLSEKGLN